MFDDRDAAAANGDHDDPRIDQRLDGIQFHDTFRQRGRNDTAPAASGIFHDGPAQFSLFCLRFLFGHETADRFGRVLECGVIFADDGLFNDRGSRFVDAGFDHFILQALDQLITDLTLALGTADFQRSQCEIGDLFRDLRFLKQETDLRTVAVADHHIPSFFDHFNNMFCGFIRCLVLALNRLVLFVFDQRISANSDNCNFLCHCLPHICKVCIW